MPVSAGLAALLEVLLSGAHAQTLIDKLVELGRAQLESQRVLIRVRIHERSPWWLPKFVDQQIFDELVGELEQNSRLDRERSAPPGARRDRRCAQVAPGLARARPRARGAQPRAADAR